MRNLPELAVSELVTKPMPLQELRKWDIFNTIDDNLLLNIRLAHVHGTFGFLISTVDTAYVIGTGTDGCLGIGHITSALSPVKIDVLTGQLVKEFVISVEESCFALTEDGRVFAWGFNSSGQLGIGNTATITTPQLIHVTGGVKISQLAAGYTHTLALAMHTGQVFAWGWNGYGQLGQENFNDRNEPGNVELNPDIKIKQISCSGDGSFALTQCGELYSWGHNIGELGIGISTPTYIPTKVIFHKPIKKVSNGANHTLVLTTSGELYACGRNAEGQLGMGKTTDVNVLTRVAADLGIIDDISSIPWMHQSSAKSMDKTFVWGEINEGLNYYSPTEFKLFNMSRSTSFLKEEGQFMHKSMCGSNRT